MSIKLADVYNIFLKLYRGNVGKHRCIVNKAIVICLYSIINVLFSFQITFHLPFSRRKARTKDASMDKDLIIMKDIKTKPCDITDL